MEIKHALAYLRLAANPDDDGAFLRVANFPARGIGARSLEALQDAAKAGETSLYKAASGLSGKSGAAVGGFLRLIESLKAENQGPPFAQAAGGVLLKNGPIADDKGDEDRAHRAL